LFHVLLVDHETRATVKAHMTRRRRTFKCHCCRHRDKTPALLPVTPVTAIGGDAVGTL
jgi:hypothetical protein